MEANLKTEKITHQLHTIVQFTDKAIENLQCEFLRNNDFFCDKSLTSLVNEYWFPTDMSEEGKITWSLSSGDVSIIEGKLKEIDGYEEAFEENLEVDPEEQIETIRRNRLKEVA